MNQVIPCLSITWNSSGSLFIMHLILNSSLSFIVTILSKIILSLLKVAGYFFTIYVLSIQNVLGFNLIFSDFSVPVILNRWMLPVVLHNFMGMYYCTYKINIIIFTALENKHPLHNFYFL